MDRVHVKTWNHSADWRNSGYRIILWYMSWISNRYTSFCVQQIHEGTYIEQFSLECWKWYYINTRFCITLHNCWLQNLAPLLNLNIIDETKTNVTHDCPFTFFCTSCWLHVFILFLVVLLIVFVLVWLTGFHRQATWNLLNWIFFEVVETDGQNHPNSPVITLVLVLWYSIQVLKTKPVVVEVV